MSVPVDKIEIWADEPERPLSELRAVTARVSVFWLRRAPTIEEVNWRLRETAAAIDADAVIHVIYQRHWGGGPLKVVRADGVAVKFDPAERACPRCDEPVRIAAAVCRFCGTDLQPVE